MPGRSTNVWKGAISDGYCQPLLLPRALARTRLHSVVVDRHNRRGASVDGAEIRHVQSQPKPRASLSSLETTEVCGLLIDHVAILCNVIKQRQSGWCPWAIGWPKWAQPIFNSALSHSSNTILYTVLSERLWCVLGIYGVLLKCN